MEMQEELVTIGQKYNIRLMGPNIYGFYYTPANLCATFCTAYDVKGSVALSSQSGGIGMAIIGFSRSAKMGVSAIVGLGNKSDIDEDDLLIFFEQDPNTKVIAQHCEDLKDGRAFAEVAGRVSKKKPVIVLKAGRTSAGAKAASSHTGALAGNDKIYEDVFQQIGVIRARSLRDMLDPIVAGARVVRSGVNIETLVLADNGLSVPFRVWVDSPMTAQDHVTDLWLLSQRNPVTVMAKMRMGPHLGRAEFSTRVRLAGGQQLVALARLSSGEFRYQVADLIVTEAGCVDGS